MSKQEVIQQNFNGGEISPRAKGRSDLPFYANGADRMENFIPDIRGGMNYRPGFQFERLTRNGSPARLASFIFNDVQSFILEFTAGRTRIYDQDTLLIEDPRNVVGVSHSTPATGPALVFIDTSTDHTVEAGDEISFQNDGGLDFRTYIAEQVLGPFSFTFFADSTEEAAALQQQLLNGTVTVSKSVGFATDFTEDMLPGLSFSQLEDTIFITSEEIVPQQVTRNSNFNWTIQDYITDDPTRFDSPDDQPRALGFFESRTFVGGSNNNPQQILGSESSVFNNFEVPSTPNATDAVAFTLASRRKNLIEWIEGTRNFMAIGTTGTIFRVTGGNLGDPISSLSVDVKPLAYHGAEVDTQPVLRDDELIYVQDGGRKVRSISFSDNGASSESQNLNLISDQITEGFVFRLAYQEGSSDLVWALKRNGELLGLTVSREENIYAWHRHNTGLSDGDTITDIQAIPGRNGYDTLFAVIKRGGVHHVEKLIIPEPAPLIEQFISSGETEQEVRDTFENALFSYQQQLRLLDSSKTFWDIRSETTSSEGLLFYQNGLPSSPSQLEPGTIATLFSINGTDLTADDIGKNLYVLNEKNVRTGGVLRITGVETGPAVGFSVEVLARLIPEDTIADDFFNAGQEGYILSHFSLSTSSPSGFDHLEGQTVSVVVDGATHPDVVVTNGVIQLDSQAEVVHAGKRYRGFFKTQSIEGGGTTGSSQTKRKSMRKVGMRVLSSLGIKIGTDPFRLETLINTSNRGVLDRPAPLFTGDITHSIGNDSHEDEKYFYIVQDEPQPANIQLVLYHIRTSNE